MGLNKISSENASDFEEEEKRKNVDNFQYYLDLAKHSKLSWDVLNTLMNDLCSSRTKSKRLNILLLKELKFLSEANSKLENKVEKMEKLNKKISNNDGNPMMTKKAKVKENLPNRNSAPKISRVHEDTDKSKFVTKKKASKSRISKHVPLKICCFLGPEKNCLFQSAILTHELKICFGH